MFYQDADASLPVLAVSSGDSVFGFKNLNPFHKFTLPHLPMDVTEQEVWVAVRNDDVGDAAFNSPSSLESAEEIVCSLPESAESSHEPNPPL